MLLVAVFKWYITLIIHTTISILVGHLISYQRLACLLIYCLFLIISFVLHKIVGFCHHIVTCVRALCTSKSRERNETICVCFFYSVFLNQIMLNSKLIATTAIHICNLYWLHFNVIYMNSVCVCLLLHFKNPLSMRFVYI